MNRVSPWCVPAPAVFLSGCVAVSVLLSAPLHASGSGKKFPPLAQNSGGRMVEAFGKLPISFEANRGQSDNQVKFLARLPGFNLFLTPSEAVLDLRATALPAADGTSHASKRAVLRMKFVAANPRPNLAGVAELPGKVNYFRGSDPKKWQNNIPTYRSVKYESLYPGVDLVYYGNQRQLEYDFVVAPGAA